MTKQLIRIAITGGAGQIAYSLLFRIGSGEMFGNDQPIALHILETKEALKALEGVKMELEDCAYPLLKEIIVSDDPIQVFTNIDYAILIGAKPRGPGMERADLLAENSKIFVAQGKALNQAASKKAKILVVGNPCNTNCWIAMKNAPNIPRENFFALTRLDQNRAAFQLANKAGAPIEAVTHVTIWGNHSATQVPDFLNAKINGRSAVDVISDLEWLEGDFITTIQKRGAAIIAARGKSSAASAANAIIDAIHALITPTAQGSWYSSALVSDGNPYGIKEDLIFSFPCRTEKDGSISIVKGLQWNEYLSSKIAITQNELIEERDLSPLGATHG